MPKVNGSEVDSIVIKNAGNATLGTLALSDSVTVDDTLTVSGAAADAKVVGDILKVHKVYDTVAAMKADTSLAAGDIVKTNGYYSAGDGGGTEYTIGSSAKYVGYVALNNGRYANLVSRGRLNALSLGFKADGTDNKTYMDAIVTARNTDYAKGNNAEFAKEQIIIFFPAGMYAFSPTIINTSGLILEGDGNAFAISNNFSSAIFCPTGTQRTYPSWSQPVLDEESELYYPAYLKGQKVTRNNVTYVSLANNNRTTPGASGSTWQRYSGTIVQDFIIMFGDDDFSIKKSSTQAGGADTGGTTYNGNGIKNIQFTTNKWQDKRHGTAHNYEVLATLILYKQFMGQFYDLSFYFCHGSGLRIACSWECHFTTLMFRNMMSQANGAFTFATDYYSVSGTSTSDTSSNYIGNMEFEAIAGPYINFEENCKVDNNAFNSIIVEDYRLDMPDRISKDATLSWGTTWTDSTWLPSGTSVPDVEYGIFNFQEASSYTNNTVNSIVASMYAVRSYTLDAQSGTKTVYTHDAIAVCFGFPRKLDFQCDMFNVQLNKANIKTLIYPLVKCPLDFNFTINNAHMNDNSREFVLDGVCRNYFVNDNRVRNSTDLYNSAYIDAYKYSIASSITETSTDVISGESVSVYVPLGKRNGSSYAKNKVTAMVIDKNTFTTQKNKTNSTLRIPITGNSLHVRIYQAAASSVLYRICDKTGATLRTATVNQTSNGWTWNTIDTSTYNTDPENYMIFYNIDSATNTPGNMIDVFYWTN